MESKRLALLFTGFLVILLLFYFAREERGQKSCLLEKSETKIECPAVHVMFADEGMDVVEYHQNGTAVHFAEMYLRGMVINESPPQGGPQIFTEESNWTEELGIKPPCVLQGQSGLVDLREPGYLLLWPVLNHVDCNGPREVTPQKLKSSLAPAGKVYLAYYVVPTKEGEFRVYESIAWGGPVKFEDVKVKCTCSIETLMAKVDDAVKSAGFVQVPSWDISGSNEHLMPLGATMYRRGDDYLYVEFSEAKGMDLVRVLMIMGDEKTVKAYAEAFTAGSIEG
ncbi:hypothetical protein FH039_10750 [Thermococcus indicus]|uniref:Uncharacterized protein n=1 Tax=Thermococcus indicus TaxID=2586643 RepID=A0A4Y5SP20_9EURY|nr:hypothetical protein [Thermococcus indicus]QDA31989.1 hypothetical protein FH039_10750 [Thermococcus indicus]